MLLKKVDDTTYIIDRKRIDSIVNLNLVLDKGIINYPKQRTQEFHIETSYESDTEEFYELMDIVSKLLLASSICLVIVILLRRKNKVQKEYVRDTSMVIDPILAEAIIDRKIGAKELVMSCVANLVNKGNIECIENDTIKL